MKLFNYSVLLTIIILLSSGCTGNNKRKKELNAATDTSAVADTGYTGIKKYYSNDLLIKQITFKNSIREGEMKSFYPGGQLYQWFWYENGLREDSAVWYYTDGQVFRTTPFKHDTIDGTQKQYYRTGALRAKLQYKKGFRVPSLEEYNKNGELITGYPEIVYDIKDNYKTTGQVTVSLGLSDKSTKVAFYRGDFTNGIFDTLKCVRLKTADGRATVILRKDAPAKQDYLGIIAEIRTLFGNKYVAYKKIDLPYKDLK